MPYYYQKFSLFLVVIFLAGFVQIGHSQTITSFAPTSGPSKTMVTIIGTGFTVSSTVKFYNNQPATTVTYVSPTKLIAEVPAGATTGVITVTAGGTATSSTNFEVISQSGTCGPTYSNICITEVYDAESGSNGYIELYNGTASSVTLTGNYRIKRAGDLPPAPDPTDYYSFPDNITIATGQVLVGRVSSTSGSYSEDFVFLNAGGTGSSAGFNEDDVLELWSGTSGGIKIDRVELSTSGDGYSFWRKTTVDAPKTTFLSTDWTMSNTESTSNLGTFTPSGSTTISSHPADNACGGALSMSVTASGSPTYQWKYNDGSSATWSDMADGSGVSGATTANLTIDAAHANSYNGYQFYCVVTAGSCTKNSNAAQYGDTEAPVITSTHNNTTVNANTSCQAILADYTSSVTATDNCSYTVSQSPASGTTISGATNTVTLTVTDPAGNLDTVSFNVSVVDVTAPVADSATLADVTAQCEVTSLTAPTATDNCSGTITGTHNVTLPLTSSATITWTYTDGAGNTSTQTQNVIIDDVTAPVTPTLADITGECSVTPTPPTTTDNCAGTITGTTTTTFPITVEGTTVVTWTFADGNGNSTTANQNVIIDDITAPVPNVANLPNISDNCSVTVSVTPTATDNCAGTITGTTTNSLLYSEPGSYIITWNYTDNFGNLFTQEQTVIVEDNPPIVETQNITVTLVNGTATITPQEIDNGSNDDCGIDSMSLDITTFTIDDIGENTVNLTVFDKSNNSATKSAIVTVIQPEFALAIPNFISPDGDGVNDLWTIQGLEQLEGFKLSIFNKIGEILYESDNYDNTWGGYYKGKILSDGTYYYIFKKEKIVYNGFISIVK